MAMLFQFPSGTLPLEFHHMAEDAVTVHQIRRGSLLYYAAFREDDDFVRRFHSAHPVGDDQNRLALEQSGEGFLNSTLIFHVQAGSGLIQKDDRCIL